MNRHGLGSSKWAQAGSTGTRTGAENKDKTRGHEPAEGGDGADCAGTAWAMVGSVRKGPSLENRRH